MFDYQKEYNEYWSRPDRWGSHSFVEPQTLVDQVLRTCGTGNLLDVGCGMGLLVREFLAWGVDAQGLDVATAPVARADKLAPGHFHLGSILDLPFRDESFNTAITTDCLEHLTETDVPGALGELYRVTRRYLFVQLATTPAREDRWHLTVHDRAWWETRFFEAGFRKHPLLQTVLPFESLEKEGSQITLIFEKIPPSALRGFPMASLRAERDLHMDMLRETGRRSDAHIARYNLARNYVRPGDTVLDLACGLGYGSAILWDGSEAPQVEGIDNSPFAVRYAAANFSPLRPTLKFREGDVADLSHRPDESVDVVVSFETIEHLEKPERLLKEVRRVLRPGGRFICSVPNQWTDGSGKDPNPHHHHVFDLAKLQALVSLQLLIEQVFAQTAGGGMKLTDHPRRLVEIDGRAPDSKAEAEWWLLVAMKDPVEGTRDDYVETIFPTGLKEELNITAFARDYRNPWLVRSMVTIGMRCRSTPMLRDFATRVLAMAPPGSADAGAALCVSSYLLLDSDSPDPGDRDQLVARLRAYIGSAEDTPHAIRWRVSNQYVLAKLLLSAGQIRQAQDEFWKCAQMDCLAFSPLLATKTVDAAFWAGWLAASQELPTEAREAWNHGLREAQHVLRGNWKEIVGNPTHPVLFGLREATLVLDAATRCANGLYALDDLPRRPGIATAQVLYSLSSELKRQQAIIVQEQSWNESTNKSRAWLEQQNAELKGWVQELDHARSWLEKQRSTWEHTAQEREKIAEEQRQSAQRLEQQNVELKGWVQELEQARNWLEKQRSTWEHTAQEREKIAEEQRGWSQRLEQAKAWLEQQATNWRQTAERREAIIEELRAWVRKLEQGKAWLEQERDRWHQLAEEHRKAIHQHAAELESYKRQVLADKETAVQQHHATAQALEQAKAELRQQLAASRAAMEKLEDTQRKQAQAVEQAEGALTASRNLVAEKDKVIQENLATIRSTEQARQELQQQLGAARAAIQSLQDTQRKQAETIEQLEGSVARLEQQRIDLLAKVERRETYIRDLEKKFLYRLLVRVKMLPPLFASEREPDCARKETE